MDLIAGRKKLCRATCRVEVERSYSETGKKAQSGAVPMGRARGGRPVAWKEDGGKVSIGSHHDWNSHIFAPSAGETSHCLGRLGL